MRLWRVATAGQCSSCRWARHGAPKRALARLLCRVLCGQMHYTEQMSDSHATAQAKQVSLELDSSFLSLAGGEARGSGEPLVQRTSGVHRALRDAGLSRISRGAGTQRVHGTLTELRRLLSQASELAARLAATASSQNREQNAWRSRRCAAAALSPSLGRFCGRFSPWTP